MRFMRRDTGVVDELDDPAVRRRLRQVKRQAKRGQHLLQSTARLAACVGVLACVMLLVGAGLSRLIRPSSGLDTTPGHGGVAVASAALYCGTPLAVFQHFGLADAQGKLMNNAPMPTAAQLAQIPKPDPNVDPNSPTAGQVISYDKATNQLCANGWTPLYVRFIQPQPAVAGSTNYNPNTPFTANNPLGTNGISLNPADWASQAVAGLWKNLWQGTVNFFQTQVIDWASSFGFMYITPAALSYKHFVVTNGENWSLGLMDGTLALVLVIGGHNLLINGPSARVLSFMLRFTATAILANVGFLAFLPDIIELNNVMCGGITNALMHAAAGSMTLPLGGLNWLEQPVTWSIFVLIDFVFALLLIIVMLVRLALLDFLIIIGPIAIMCYAIPQLESVGRFWCSAFFCTLFVQFCIVGTLALGSALIAGFGHASSTPITLFLGIATLYLAFKWTGMVNNSALRSSAGAVWRDIAIVVNMAIGHHMFDNA